MKWNWYNTKECLPEISLPAEERGLYVAGRRSRYILFDRGATYYSTRYGVGYLEEITGGETIFMQPDVGIDGFPEVVAPPDKWVYIEE